MGSTNGIKLSGGFNGNKEIVVILDSDNEMNPHNNSKKIFGCFTACVIVSTAQNHNKEKIYQIGGVLVGKQGHLKINL